MQFREGNGRQEAIEGGRLPYENEVIGNKTPPFQVTGVDAISPLLMHVTFPATKEQIMELIGGAQIAVNKTKTMPLRDILDKTAPREFRNRGEVEQAINHVWGQILPHPDPRGSHHQQRDDFERREPR